MGLVVFSDLYKEKQPRRFTALLTVILTLALAACDKQPALERELETYNTRLANVLETELPKFPKSHSHTLKLTPLALAPSEITLLEFLRLFGCELQHTIGKSNSQMGKLAPASQQLITALYFQHHVTNCLAVLQQRGEDKLREKLLRAAKQKQAQLPKMIYNATLAAPEFSELWRPQYAPDYPENIGPDVIEALDHLYSFIRAWLDGDYLRGINQLESTLVIIRTTDAGTLRHSLAVNSAYLSVANTMIEQRIVSHPLCPLKKPNQQSQILENVVLKFFIQSVQRRHARLNHRFYELMPAITRIETLLEHRLNKSDLAPFQRWKQIRDKEMTSNLDITKRHVATIKKILATCGSSFGS